MTKYRVVVMTDGSRVWIQMRLKRRISFFRMVRKATR